VRSPTSRSAPTSVRCRQPHRPLGLSPARRGGVGDSGLELDGAKAAIRAFDLLILRLDGDPLTSERSETAPVVLVPPEGSSTRWSGAVGNLMKNSARSGAARPYSLEACHRGSSERGLHICASYSASPVTSRPSRKLSQGVLTDRHSYIQRLPAVDLAIERATERTPDRSRYYVFRGDEVVGAFRRLPDAQGRFREIRDNSGWKAPERASDPVERLKREKAAQERHRQMEHWHRVSRRRGWFKGHRV
jgi:hypothetical protein